MVPAAKATLAELEQETPATRRLLELVPEEKLAWRPHAKSMSLAQLAHHVASIPGSIARMAAMPGMDAATANFEPKPAESAAALLPTLEASVAAAKAFLEGLTEESAVEPWTLSAGERQVFTIPRLAVMRTLCLNHWYHHRGQLTVYLRLLDLPLPATYGRSADENPMAPRSDA